METVLSVYNSTPPKPCQYRYPVSNTAEFLGLGNLINGIGFGAAIGLGIALSVSDPSLVAVVGSTVTVEARHDAFIRLQAGLQPSPSPYDTEVPGVWAYNWFNQFIVPGSCPTKLDADIPIFPPLDVPAIGRPVLDKLPRGPQTFIWDQEKVAKSKAFQKDAPLYIAWVNGLNKPVYTKIDNVLYKPGHKNKPGSGRVAIPKGLSGLVTTVLTQNNTAELADDLTPYVLAGPYGITVT